MLGHCPSCGLPRRRTLLTPDGKTFSFPGFSVRRHRGLLLASGACCCACTDQFLRPDEDVDTAGFSASSGTPLYPMIDEVTPDSSDYITRTISTAESLVLKIGFSNGTAPDFDTGHILRLSGYWTGRPTSQTMYVAQSGAPLANKDVSFGNSTYVTETLTMLTTEADDITDYSALRFWLALGNSPVSSGGKYLHAPYAATAGGFTIVGASTALEAVRVDVDGKYLDDAVGVQGLNPTFSFSFGDPNDDTGHAIRVLGSPGQGNDIPLSGELKQGASTIKTWSAVTNGISDEWLFSLASGEAGNITNYGDLVFLLTTDGANIMDITYVTFSVPASGGSIDFRLRWAEFEIQCP